MSDRVDKSSRTSGSQHGPRALRQGARAPGIPGLDDLKPRESRSRADELKYFMVSTSCLQCRKTVQAPVDKLHYKLRCPHCGMLMHLRQDGKWYPGVHPSLEAGEVRTSWGQRARTWWIGRSTRTRRSLFAGAGLALACLLSFAALALMNPPRQDLPDSIEERATIVAQSLATGDSSRSEALIAPGTHREAEQWFDLVRERIDASDVAGTPVQEIELQVLFVNWKERKGAISTHFRNGESDVFSCMTMWLLDPDERWMLDGARSLDDFSVGRAPDVRRGPEDNDL